MDSKINVLGIYIDNYTGKEAMKEAVGYMESDPVNIVELLTVDAVMDVDLQQETKEQLTAAYQQQVNQVSAQLAQNNLTLDDYCKFSNSTLEQLREDARPGAEEAVRIKALVRRVAQAEELPPAAH